MSCKLTMLLAFLLTAAGCGEAATRQAARPALTPVEPIAKSSADEEAPATPAATLAEADSLARSQLGASRGGQFERDRQVGELRRAMLLYQKFLELSDGRPELEPAVKKSREALADLQATLDFLLQEQGAESPPH